LAEYYFTIIGYIYFYNHYDGDDCSSLWRCFLSTFDFALKRTGALGTYLHDPNLWPTVDGETNMTIMKPISHADGEGKVISVVELVYPTYVARFIYD
jgi:hypothetical protein